MDGAWRACRGQSGPDLLKRIPIAMREVRTSSLAAREVAPFCGLAPPVERRSGRLLAIHSQSTSLTGGDTENRCGNPSWLKIPCLNGDNFLPKI